MLRPIPTSNKTQIPKTGRRGSLPTESTALGGKIGITYRIFCTFHADCADHDYICERGL